LLPGVYHVPFGSSGLDELESRVFKRLIPADEFAAVFVEPVQGEGGYVIPDREFLPRLRRICDEHGILLVADEVQSGMGRTGRMWAVEHWDVKPDILLAAKGIASGLPLGAMVTRADLMNWPLGAHGSTFGGNPVSCAAALATIKLLEEGLIANARDRGEQALEGLRSLIRRHERIVRDVRGLGLMIGVQFDSGATAEAVQWACFRRGLLVLAAGDDALRLAPPLVVNPDEMSTALRLFGEAVAEVDMAPRDVMREASAAGAVNEVEAAG
jgi:4-aminobutyrate aminotransferase